MKIIKEPPGGDWPELITRPAIETASLEATVSAILAEVKSGGDTALKKFSTRFDGVDLEEIKVSAEAINAAPALVSDELKEAIGIAVKNIRAFHAAQQEQLIKIETMPGVVCWRRSVAIEKVGLYIPGGTAPLFSTLLMLGIPALIAGCKEIVVCTPCDKNGEVSPLILYVANILGIGNIFKVGGAQAIAAMAYGTKTIPAVYKIFGPGNQYVTCAKQMIAKENIAIDMPAGPSEVAVYADESATPAFIAADLLSQAEHGPDSQVLLVASNETIANKILEAVGQQLQALPRKHLAEVALTNSKFIVLENVDTAFELLNAYAPEHLIIASDNAGRLAEKVVNAGSVFLGHYAAEAVGDYASGTNHTLPTNGYAKVYAGVSLDSFVKKISFQQLSKTGLANIGPAVIAMAKAEGLEGHANAVKLRVRN